MAITAKWTDFSSLDGAQVISTVNRTVPKWVTLALVAGIAWQLAQIIWTVIPGSSAGDHINTPPLTQAAGAAVAGRRADVQAIADAHLFGEADKTDTPAPPPEVAEDLAETRLNLSLKGTVAANDQRSSVAIIADQTNEDKVYAIGDSIMSGTSLHAV
jgi:type II secretion system protein C